MAELIWENAKRLHDDVARLTDKLGKLSDINSAHHPAERRRGEVLRCVEAGEPMTLEEAKEVSDLLHARFELEDWLESLAGTDYPNCAVFFGDIAVAKGGRAADGNRHGWQGNLTLRRDDAVAMLRWLLGKGEHRLEELGVSVKGEAATEA